MSYRPFPVELLPDGLSAFVSETARAIDCDPAFVGLPALSVLGASIGTTRTIQLKPTWQEFPVIWTALIARSGQMKSPAMKAPIVPLQKEQRYELKAHAVAMRDYENARLTYEKDMTAWKRRSDGAPPPEKPEVPMATRYVVSDTTVEALAPILLANPRGVLVYRDELAGLIRGQNQYKSGKGSDSESWLELWNAGVLTVDRKGSPAPIVIPRAAVSITGSIQPGIFAQIMRGQHTESGLAARFLISAPPPRPKTWSNRTPPENVVQEFSTTIIKLLSLSLIETEYGAEPGVLNLDIDAMRLWARFVNEHGIRTYEAGDDAEAAVLAKLEAYSARFALINALYNDHHSAIVGADDIRRGIALADWFANESARLYLYMSESDEEHDIRNLIGWIRRKGGPVTARDLKRNLRRFESVEDAEAALEQLAGNGFGTYEFDADPVGGRPTRRFQIHAERTADETPDSTLEVRVSSALVPTFGDNGQAYDPELDS